MGAAAHVLDGKERLELLYNILHPEGGQFAFEWDWLPASGDVYKRQPEGRTQLETIAKAWFRQGSRALPSLGDGIKPETDGKAHDTPGTPGRESP